MLDTYQYKSSSHTTQLQRPLMETYFATILAEMAPTNIWGLRSTNTNRQAGKDMSAQQADNFPSSAHGMSVSAPRVGALHNPSLLPVSVLC